MATKKTTPKEATPAKAPKPKAVKAKTAKDPKTAVKAKTAKAPKAPAAPKPPKSTTPPSNAKGMTLNAQMQEIIRQASENGVDKNFFFITTFQRYQMQIRILQELKKVIDKEDIIVSKEYVKGRKNVYSHPAIKDYNRTTDSANKTAALLLKITNLFRKHPIGEDEDPLLKALNDIDMDDDTEDWTGADDRDDDDDEDRRD